MGCPVLMVWVRLYLNISCCSCFFLATDHWPLLTTRCPLPAVSCALRIPYCPIQSIPPNAQKGQCSGVMLSNRACPPTSPLIRPQKKFPGAGPRASRICNTGYENRGPVPGKGLAGGGPRGTGLSLRGGALQGLFQRWESYEAGLSKVFSIGGNLTRRGSPKASPLAKLRCSFQICRGERHSRFRKQRG